jgi:hypothetical protein
VNMQGFGKCNPADFYRKKSKSSPPMEGCLAVAKRKQTGWSFINIKIPESERPPPGVPRRTPPQEENLALWNILTLTTYTNTDH